MRTAGITAHVHEHLRASARVYPVHVNRASEIGHPCLRYLVYTRIAHDQRIIKDPNTILLLRDGNYHEKATTDIMTDSGYSVIEQQRSFKDDDYQISGHIDGKVLLGQGQHGDMVVEDGQGYASPFEIKGLAGATWRRLAAADDLMEELRTSKQPWLRKYPGQIQTYLGLDKKPWGLFILKNKWTSHLCDRVIEFDEEYFEGIKMRAEACNLHVETRTLPGRIDDGDLCGSCDFAHICLTEHGEGEFPEEDAELGLMLERRETLKALVEQVPYIEELSDLETEIKDRVQGRERVLAGNWIVTGKEVAVKGYEQKPYTYWRPNYKRIE